MDIGRVKVGLVPWVDLGVAGGGEVGPGFRVFGVLEGDGSMSVRQKRISNSLNSAWCK